MSLAKHFDDTLKKFAGFEKHPTLAVAVSGGADSTALLLLAHRWARKHSGTLVALSVDHGLRTESAAEAQQVRHMCADLGITHHTLDIKIPNTQSAVQEQARNLRYEVMERFCQTHHILHLLTAHHLDDAAETIAMRAWRGSGVDGLSGIPSIRYSHHVRILRPLLNVKKERLIDFLHEQKISWLEDPSNQSDNYERNRLRKTLGKWPVDTQALQNFSAQMSVAKTSLDESLAGLALHSLKVCPLGYIEINTSLWKQYMPEQCIGLLNRITQSIGKDDVPARHYQLEHLYENISQDEKTISLKGLHFMKTAPFKWAIFREAEHVEGKVEIKPNTTMHWDGRFSLSFSVLNKNNDPFQLGALGENGLLQLKELGWIRPKGINRLAFLTIPAIWHLDQLVLVPHIHIESHKHFAKLTRLTQRWRRPLLGSPHRNYLG